MEKLIEDYISKSDWRINENANTSFSGSGMKSYIASSILAKYSLSKLPEKIRKAHKEGAIHIHDLDGGIMVPYCYGADLQQLMLEGLKNPVGSCSNPAKHFDSLVDHMVNYLYISQSEFNGAQAFSNVDTLLAPYVIGQDYKYVIQNIQRLIYNISYPLRSSFQTPFINFSFDLIPPKHMANEPVIIGGKVSENMVYGDLQKEMDLINGCFLELMIKGDSMGKPFTFPIPTYGITKDVMNKNDDVTRLLYTLTAKFGSPNFQNYLKSGNDPSDVRSMCCRLRLDIAKLKSRGLWNIGNKTGSVGVCTIDLNHATKDGTEHFMENIDEAYDLSVEELSIKREHVEDAFKKGLFPFTKQYLPSFKTFFNTVGTHAMNEACLSMFESPIEENQSFVIRTLRYLRKRVDETTEETEILHNLEESPAEGATYRLAKLDRKLGLPVQGGEHPYLTNSTHCPVNTNVGWIENLRIQERFKPFYSGGTIVHGFVGEEMSPQSAEHLIKQISLNTTIPYYNITPIFSHCNTHGHMTGNVDLCPKCGKENLIYSRVVGYIQPYQKWNDGKKSEFKDRKMYNMKDI